MGLGTSWEQPHSRRFEAGNGAPLRLQLHRGIVDEGPFTPLGNCLVVQPIPRR